MIKIMLLISFILLGCKSISQNQKAEQAHTQNPNTKSSEMLTSEEAELLNSLLQNSRGTFDFHGKKVAFITGPAGNRFLSKSGFFAKIGESGQIDHPLPVLADQCWPV